MAIKKTMHLAEEKLQKTLGFVWGAFKKSKGVICRIIFRTVYEIKQIIINYKG